MAQTREVVGHPFQPLVCLLKVDLFPRFLKALSKKEQILELFRTTEMKSSMDLLGVRGELTQVTS